MGSARAASWTVIACAVLAGCGRTTPPDAAPAPAAPAAAASPAEPGERRFALLVGVTEFVDPGMSVHNLKGPANDAALMRAVLEGEPFVMSPDKIAVLAGLPPDLDRRPTRANIERELSRLRDEVRTGDQVVLFLAGHGSQQPAEPDPADPEPDGLDEIFLPADATGWDGSLGRVRNAVVDDDVRRWITGIRSRGAFVWLVVDACQSGTLARGAAETDRRISMEALGVPAAAIGRAARDGRSSGQRGSSADRVMDLDDGAGEIAALYAAHMSETTPERPLPNDGGPIHGLFTYTLATILKETSSPLTYRELAQRVTQRYRAGQRFTPTPTFEGAGLDRPLFGQTIWPDRPRMLLGASVAANEWELDAGSISGLTAGSILEIFPPAGTAGADQAIGFMRVTAVQPTSARVSPVNYLARPAPAAAALVAGARVRVKAYDYGDLRVKVALQSASRGTWTTVPRGTGPSELETALAEAVAQTAGLVDRRDRGTADWYVRVESDQVSLLPAAGWHAGGQNTLALGSASSPDFASTLGSALRRIARATNLMRLAAGSGQGPNLELTVTRFKAKAGGTGAPLLDRGEQAAVRVGEFLEFSVHNRGNRALDVSVLFIDSGFGIEAVFPGRDTLIDNRVAPGERRRLLDGRAQINQKTLGFEYLVAIGVESSSTPQDFSILEQDTIETVRSSGALPQSPLSKLLFDAMFGQDASRGLTRHRSAETFAVRLVGWRTVSSN